MIERSGPEKVFLFDGSESDRDPEDLCATISFGFTLLYLFVILLAFFVDGLEFFLNPAICLPAVLPVAAAGILSRVRSFDKARYILLASMVGYIAYVSFVLPDLVDPLIYFLAVSFPLILIPPLRIPGKVLKILLGMMIIYMLVYTFLMDIRNPALVVFPIIFSLLTGFSVWYFTLTSARSRENEERLSQTLTRLYQFAMGWSKTADFDTALRAALNVLEESFPGSRIGIMLADENHKKLVIRASIGYPFEIDRDYSISVESGLTGWSFRNGEGVRVGNVSQDERYVMLDPDVQSEMCVPLKAGERIVGIINLESMDRNAYSVEEEHFLATMAPLLASFILNAQLQLETKFLTDMNQTLLETAPAGFITYTQLGECVYVNQAMVEILGENLASVLEKNLFELPHWKKVGLTEAAREAIRSSTLQKLDPGLVHWNGEKVIEYYLQPFSVQSEPHLLVMALDNTEQARMQRALEDERNFVSTVLDNAGALVMVVDTAGKIWRFNTACEQLAGVPASEVLGRHINEVLNLPDALPLTQMETSDKVDDIGTYQFTAPWVLEDGSQRLIDWSSTVVFDSEGDVDFVIAVGKDITEEQEVADRLRLQAEALNSAANGIVITSPDGVIEWVNPAVTRLTGYSAEEVLGKNPRILKSGKQDPATYADLWQTITAGKVWQGRLINRRKNGSTYHESMTVTPVLDDDGQIRHYIAIKSDVTEQYEMEQALRESEQRFRAFITGSSVGMFIGNDSGRCIEVNPALAVMLGYTVDELTGLRILDLIHPVDEEESTRVYRTLLEGEQEQAYINIRIIRKNGQQLWARAGLGLVRNTEGEPVYVIGMIEDLSDRHWAEEALAQSERRLEQITNSVDQCIYSFSITRDGELVSPLITPSISKFSGYNVEAHLTDPDLWLDAIHPDDRDRVREKYEPQEARDERVFLNYRVIDRDGRVHWIKDDTRFIFNQSGRPVRMDGVLTDITALKNAQAALEEQIQKVERANIRLRELDRLKSNFLANVSHELRTPLNSIIGFAELLVDGLAGTLNDQQQEFMEDIHSSGKHLLELINDILDLSKIEAGRLEIHPGPFDFPGLVEETAATTANLFDKKNQRLVIEVQEKLPLINADRIRIKQVLLNLLSNANKFTLEGGEVRLQAAQLDPSALIVSVSDTGIGIAEEDYDSVFAEFQQVDSSATREAQGTGLGIPISRRIVEIHGGRLWLESELGVGTTFTFILPFTGPAKLPEAVTDSEDQLLLEDEQRPLAMVIEDDRSYANILSFHFNLEGFEVIQVFNGKEALARAAELNPCLITLDLMLPDMDGWELLKRLKADPKTMSVPVVVLSALDEEEAGWGFWRDYGAAAHLVKPVQHEDILKLLGTLNISPMKRRLLICRGPSGFQDFIQSSLKRCMNLEVVFLNPDEKPASIPKAEEMDLFAFFYDTFHDHAAWLSGWVERMQDLQRPIIGLAFSDAEITSFESSGVEIDASVLVDIEHPQKFREDLKKAYEKVLLRQSS